MKKDKALVNQIRYRNFQFWHIFAYHSYRQYVRALHNANWLFFVVALCLIILPIVHLTIFANMMIILAYVYIAYCVLIFLRNRTLNRVHQMANKIYHINARYLYMTDYASYDEQHQFGQIAMTIFPEHLILTNLFLIIKNQITRHKQNNVLAHLTNTLNKIHAIINEQHDNQAEYLITLPNDKQLLADYQKYFTDAKLKLTPSNEPSFAPTYLTWLSATNQKYPTSWQTFKLTINHK